MFRSGTSKAKINLFCKKKFYTPLRAAPLEKFLKKCRFWLLTFQISQKIAPFLKIFKLSQHYEGRQQWKSVIMVVIPSVWRMIAVDFCLFEPTICHYFGLFSFNVLSSICSKVFCYHGVLALGHIKLPLPNLFKRIVPEEISSDLSLLTT